MEEFSSELVEESPRELLDEFAKESEKHSEGTPGEVSKDYIVGGIPESTAGGIPDGNIGRILH